MVYFGFGIACVTVFLPTIYLIPNMCIQLLIRNAQERDSTEEPLLRQAFVADFTHGEAVC